MEALKRELVGATLLSFLTFEICGTPLPSETAQSRIKQIGLMATICALHQIQRPITIAILVGMTGLSRTAVVEATNQLVARGYLTEKLGKNSMGRGTAWHYTLASALLERPAPSGW
ncbi:transcriptional regulator [Allorhizobium pseudoryzae]|uniref:transcriptional regulator n=1 Tax=Allorhizobium pseudoryzae TaxID=379684 RepID=UPI003D0259BF